MIGSGFWAEYQIAAWGEIEGVEIQGISSLDRPRLDELAEKFSIPLTFDSAKELVESSEIDLIDVISSVSAHVEHVRMAIAAGKTVICQKPLAETYDEAEALRLEAETAGVRLLVHENWRYQSPFVKVRELLATDVIGKVHRSRLQMTSGFPVLQNQPALGEMERFILSDLGIHVLDTARSLFGEAESLFCLTTTTQEIKGENVASVLLKMTGVPIVSVELGYAGVWSEDHFPETYALIEGSKGSIEIRKGHRVLVTTEAGVQEFDASSEIYPWVDPRYALVQSSMVPCIQSMVDSIRSNEPHPLDAGSNIKSMWLVEASYQSAKHGTVVQGQKRLI